MVRKLLIGIYLDENGRIEREVNKKILKELELEKVQEISKILADVIKNKVERFKQIEKKKGSLPCKYHEINLVISYGYDREELRYYLEEEDVFVHPLHVHWEHHKEYKVNTFEEAINKLKEVFEKFKESEESRIEAITDFFRYVVGEQIFQDYRIKA